MASTINAANTGGGGIIHTADSSGPHLRRHHPLQQRYRHRVHGAEREPDVYRHIDVSNYAVDFLRP